MTPKGCLKLQLVLNPMHTLCFCLYIPTYTFRLLSGMSEMPVSLLLCFGATFTWNEVGEPKPCDSTRRSDDGDGY